jgi:alpha-mannosidase
VLFATDLPPLGFAVYHVQVGLEAGEEVEDLVVGEGRLENEILRAKLDDAGDLVSLFHKGLGRELLAGPVQLELLKDRSKRFPAWEIHYEDLAANPLAVVGRPAAIRIVESGPVRVALSVSRRCAGSCFTQRYRLARGLAGDRLEVETDIQWHSRGRLLKARFPLAPAPEKASYDLGLGVVERGVNSPDLYEVPAQQWADLTEEDGSWGVAVLNDCRYGWDRPHRRTLRLTLLRTPATGRRFRHQGFQDLGSHRLTYAITGHEGSWQDGGVPWVAARLNQPPLAFLTSASPGFLGRQWSFLSTTTDQALVRAIKQSEVGGERLVVRLQEVMGCPGETGLRSSGAISRAEELSGVEDPGGDVPVSEGGVTLALTPFAPRTLALTLDPPRDESKLELPRSATLDLPRGDAGLAWKVLSRDGESVRRGLDGKGRCLPLELLPDLIEVSGTIFRCSREGLAMRCQGQWLELPPGDHNTLELLVANGSGDRTLSFLVGGKRIEEMVPDTFAALGRGDRPVGPSWLWPLLLQLRPGYARQAKIARVLDHCHDGRGRNKPYHVSCIFRLALPLPGALDRVRLPEDEGVAVLAATVSWNPHEGTQRASNIWDFHAAG